MTARLMELGGRLRRIYLAAGWPRELVEEVVQETLLRVWRRGRAVRAPWPFAWQVSRREMARQGRGQLRRRRAEELLRQEERACGGGGGSGWERRLQEAADGEEPEGRLDGEIMGALLAQAGPRHQLLGWLCWVVGADSAAAAAAIGMAPGAVRMRLSRLRRRLRQAAPGA